MKKLEKMSLANLQGKLTRKEMKSISGGSGGGSGGWPSSPNYVYGGDGQAMLRQANSYGNPKYPSNLNAPVGGYASNDANELSYFGQAISNGIQTVATTVTNWLK